MTKRTLFMLTAALTVSLVAGSAGAQERCKVMGEIPAGNSNYSFQHMLDVGDKKGHQIGLFELVRTYPNDQVNCEGLKRVHSKTWGWRDNQDRNGRSWGYAETTHENGDKIFSDFSGTTHSVVGADGKRKTTYVGVATYTGGTGKYQGVRGVQRDVIVIDPEKNITETKSETEYWFEK